jgi:excisionase family DNA binding protein
MTLMRSNPSPEYYEEDILLTCEDVAHQLNVSLAFAYRLVQRGEIPAVRIGRLVRVRSIDLQQFITDSVAVAKYTL